MNAVADDPAPRFLYALTNFNHGPHNRRLAAPGQFERERAFAASSLPDAQYAEYYARLAETASTWKRIKLALATDFPRRPVLIVHYGDHQPVLAKRIDRQLRLPTDARRAFRTFYTMEALNIVPDRLASGPGADLDIAFLGTAPCSRQVCRLIRYLPPAPACSTIAGKPTLHRLPNESADSIARL